MSSSASSFGLQTYYTRYEYGVSELEIKADEFRGQAINFKNLLETGIITQQEYEFLRDFEEASWTRRSEIISNNREYSSEILLRILNKIASEDRVSQILVLIDEIIRRSPANAIAFESHLFPKSDGEANIFIKFIGKSNKFHANMAASILAQVAYQSDQVLQEDDQRLIFNFLFEQLRAEGNEYVDTSGHNLQILLKKAEYQSRFIRMNGLNVIFSVLNRKECKTQLQYHLIFSLWLLSYRPTYVEQMSDYNVVPTLVRILEESEKEKVLRISLATLRNCLEKPEKDEIIKKNVLHMLRTHLIRYLDIIESRKFDDPEVVDDIAYLRESLEGYTDTFSSLDEYLLEVQSGLLEWGFIHNSEPFWSQNAAKLNNNNYQTLKQLIHLLDSEDPSVQAIACHDIGKYLKFNKNGKWVIEKLGGKHKITSLLLTTQNLEVRSKALLCLQYLVATDMRGFDLMIGKIQESFDEGTKTQS